MDSVAYVLGKNSERCGRLASVPTSMSGPPPAGIIQGRCLPTSVSAPTNSTKCPKWLSLSDTTPTSLHLAASMSAHAVAAASAERETFRLLPPLLLLLLLLPPLPPPCLLSSSDPAASQSKGAPLLAPFSLGLRYARTSDTCANRPTRGFRLGRSVLSDVA